jgi:hypothetical protein
MKAFGSVQRQILFNILKARNIPDKLLQAIADIYRRNKISIKLNSKCSKSCSLSPNLLHIYEIIKIWQEQDMKGTHLARNKNIPTILFADASYHVRFRR